MKLSPVANSSDLQVAREIAQRLHQQTQPARPTRAERPSRPAGPPARPAPLAPASVPAVAPAPRPPAAVRPAPAPQAGIRTLTPARQIEHAPAPWLPSPAEPAPPTTDERDLALGDSPTEAEDLLPPVEELAPEPSIDLETEPAPPSWDEPRPIATRTGGQEPEDALDALTAQSELTPGFGIAGVPSIEIEEPPTEDAETIVVPDQSGLDALPDADPFGESGGEIPFETPEALVPPAIEEPGSAEEELFDTSPPPPSWGEIAETCMALAHARGALLADSTGQLVAVRGEWPEPGPEAIASRLVAMMERTLRDAPTRSVSAPVGPQHLTAWRVPVGERLLTAAFLADTPVRADVRPSIDAEVLSGA